MDEENLKASILTYKQQLQQVETVLLSAGTDGQTELFQLKEDLQEVIQLTEESLLSLTKSKLLSLVDTATETNSLRVTMGSLDASSSGPSLGNDAFSDFDKEFALFQAAIADDDAYYTTQSAVSASTSSGPSSTTCQDVMRRAEARDDAENANEEDDISGTKCSVFHMEEWGRRQRHNAVVMSVEPRADSGDEASLRVLFCNPTTTSMKPCPYYLEGSCRFSVEDCRFSHGYVVKLSELHSFKEPDFSLLKLEAPCLARYSDGVWYPATIQHIDEDQHQVTVQYESYGTTATLDVESVLPSDQQDDPSPNLSSSSDDDDNDDNDESNESNFPSSSSRRDTPTPEEEEDVPCVAWRPSGDGVPLGEWEAHTRGIGSKLMALMGYEFGKGLGRYGEGRVEPVEAVIVPQGKSLDKCMELREMKKLGIVGKQKKKKRKSKGQHHHGNGSSSLGGEPRKKESIFDFLNKKLGGKKTKIAELIQQNMDNRMFLEKDSTTMNKEEGNTSRTLNIQLVNTQEDIRNTERRLIRLQESLQRNQRFEANKRRECGGEERRQGRSDYGEEDDDEPMDESMDDGDEGDSDDPATGDNQTDDEEELEQEKERGEKTVVRVVREDKQAGQRRQKDKNKQKRREKQREDEKKKQVMEEKKRRREANRKLKARMRKEEEQRQKCEKRTRKEDEERDEQRQGTAEDDIPGPSSARLSIEDDSEEDVLYDLFHGTGSSSPESTDVFFSASSSEESGTETSQPPMPARRRRQATPQPPGSDVDPDPFDPATGVRHRTDRHGWTRDVTKIKTKQFTGPTPFGPKFDRPNGDDPLEYFLSFFPLFLFSKIADYTNTKASSNPRFTQKTSASEIKAWFGIRMMQGVHTNTNAEDDWSVHPGLRNNLVSSTMTRGRFYLLSEVLACTNPAKGPQRIGDRKDRFMWMKSHPVYPLQIIWDTVNDNCLQNYNPRRELSLDEAMIKYKGTKANIKRFFMPLKPTKMGFKIYAVCEARSGYLLSMKVHSESGLKMKDLSLQMMQPFLGRYHRLFCDKLYTSAALAKYLLDEKTYLCGAVKRSSKGLPDDFSVSQFVNPTKHQQISMMHKSPRGTMYSRQQGQLTVVLWRDTKVVSLLSTCHQGYRDRATHHLIRNIKDKGKKTTSNKQVPAPPHAIDYTQFMGGVDKSDQLRSYQSCSHQSMAWWMKVLYFLVDVARVNAWICYKQNTKADPDVSSMSHRMFTVDIATRLIAGFAEGTPAHQAHSLPPVPAVNGPNHTLIRMPDKNPKMCIQCRRDDRTTRLGYPVVTRTGCASCNIHLCKDVCFLKFHSA